MLLVASGMRHGRGAVEGIIGRAVPVAKQQGGRAAAVSRSSVKRYATPGQRGEFDADADKVYAWCPQLLSIVLGIAYGQSIGVCS